MAKLLQIAQLGHPVLRETAAPIENPKDAALQSLVEDMLATVTDVNGVGIAAPQVYESKQIFIISSKSNPRYPLAPDMEPVALINPEILWKSHEMEKDWEGCLSIPGIRARVPRHIAIKIKFTTLENAVVEISFTDFVARIFQHEFDHLNGRVFLDRLESTQDIVTEKEFLKIIAQQPILTNGL